MTRPTIEDALAEALRKARDSLLNHGYARDSTFMISIIDALATYDAAKVSRGDEMNDAMLSAAHSLCGYYLPNVPDADFVNVCNGDLRRLKSVIDTYVISRQARGTSE